MIQFRYSNVLGLPLALVLAGSLMNGYNINKFCQYYGLKAELDRYADAQLVHAVPEVEMPAIEAEAVNQAPLTPQLACEFVKWLVQGAFDFNPNTESRSHIEAAKWMTLSPYQTMESLFWKPSEDEVVTFQPYSVEYTGGNAKTGLEVTVLTSMSKQVSEQHFKSTAIEIKFKVKCTKDGLRITDIDISNGDKALLIELME
ncbi:MAG: hypothetical protein IPG59_05565 [Candidatus Melainabacteria bacterium]|nr:MAG: hypothetical protein IPG59_05565 [Candidatus Melainabacteria bacterium]